MWYTPISIVGLGLVVLTVGCLVWLWYSVFRTPKDGLARCGACGYAVRGIESLTCPECGTDLREAGIVTSARRGMIGPVVFLFLWPTLLAIPSVVFVGVVTVLSPQVSSGTYSATLTPRSGTFGPITMSFSFSVAKQGRMNTSVSTRRSGNQSSVTFNVLSPSRRPDQIELAMAPMRGQTDGVLEINASTLRFRSSVDGGGFQDRVAPLGAAAVKRWLIACGVDVSPSTLDAETVELASIVAGVAQGRSTINAKLFSTGGASARTSSRPATAPLVVSLVVCAAVWIGGMILYFRWRADVKGGGASGPSLRPDRERGQESFF